MNIGWAPTLTALFTQDFQFYMGGREMEWKFVDGTHIQVEQYPYLHISRSTDWGWELRNSHVVLRSLERKLPQKKSTSTAAATRTRAISPTDAIRSVD